MLFQEMPLPGAAESVGLSSSPTSGRWGKALLLGAVLVVATGFVLKYVVFRYYLHYDEADFVNFWRIRGWLLVHITAGMLALLIGPFQFSQRLRQRYLQMHRIAGRVYVTAVLFGCVAAVRLALAMGSERAFGFGLGCLAFAWAVTTSMAFYAVRRGQIAVHKEWMVRSYVVTFAFVFFRMLTDYPPVMSWLPEADRYSTSSWLCWAIPLLITEVILQLRRMPKKATPRPSA